MSSSDNQPTTIVPANIPPTLNIIACGGCGINMVRAALPDISNRATYRYLDTSKANLRPGETAQIIGGGGSGLVRSHNADATMKAISSLSDEDIGVADINIVVFSLSGGSGSVVGPMLIGDIYGRRKKLVIALTIASTQSQKHTENTLRALQSLRNVATENEQYLPISIFNNSAGVKHVDSAFPYKLARLVDLLTAPTIEIDKNDRIHWLNVPKTLDKPLVGMRLLHVRAKSDGYTEGQNIEIQPKGEGYIFDSLLSIRTEQYDIVEQPRARVSFEGLFSTIKMTPMYGVLGNPPNAFDELLAGIKNTLREYEAHSDEPHDPFGSDDGSKKHKTGLVL